VKGPIQAGGVPLYCGAPGALVTPSYRLVKIGKHVSVLGDFKCLPAAQEVFMCDIIYLGLLFMRNIFVVGCLEYAGTFSLTVYQSSVLN